MLRALLSLSLVVGSLAVMGCGGDEGGGTVDITPYGELIILVSDTAARGKKPFAELFAEGVTVSEADRKKYAQLSYSVESATTDGSAAQLKISIYDIEGNDKGIVDWVAVKEGDKWKLKDAPLP